MCYLTLYSNTSIVLHKNQKLQLVDCTFSTQVAESTSCTTVPTCRGGRTYTRVMSQHECMYMYLVQSKGVTVLGIKFSTAQGQNKCRSWNITACTADYVPHRVNIIHCLHHLCAHGNHIQLKRDLGKISKYLRNLCVRVRIDVICATS